MNTVIEDLFHPQNAFRKELSHPNLAQSHYGFPELDYAHIHCFSDFISNFPDQDSELIYGFNLNIEKELQSSITLSILDKVAILHKKNNLDLINPLDYNVKNEHDFTVTYGAREILQ